MMQCVTPPRTERAFDVSSKWSDSGVVMRMCGGCLRRRWRSACGGVAGANGNGQIRKNKIHLLGERRDAKKGQLQIAIDIVVEGLQPARYKAHERRAFISGCRQR